MEDIKEALKIYALTLTIPVIITFMMVIQLFLGFTLKISILDFWLDYYITGIINNIVPTYKVHILILILIYLFVKLDNIK